MSVRKPSATLLLNPAELPCEDIAVIELAAAETCELLFSLDRLMAVPVDKLLPPKPYPFICAEATLPAESTVALPHGFVNLLMPESA